MSSITQAATKAYSVMKDASSKTLVTIKKLDVQKQQTVIIQTGRKTVVPVCSASSLFFMWGLAYGLLDILNYHVRLALHLDRQRAAYLALAYYSAYLCTPFIHGPVVKKCGYRLAMFFGPCILACGMEFNSLGAANCSFNGMAGGHFVIGLGVSMLERAANPYCTNCGPRKQAALRLLVAQACAGIGTVVAPFLANTFIFNPDSSNVAPLPDLARAGTCVVPNDEPGSCENLGSVIKFYRVLGGVVFGMAVGLGFLFFRTKCVPEVPIPTSPPTPSRLKLWKHQLVSLKYTRIFWGLLANFFNLGCQVTFAQFFIEHMKVNACQSDRWATNAMSIAQGAFVVGRFSAAALIAFPRIFKPRWVLAGFIAGAIAFTGAGTYVTGHFAIGLAAAVMFCEAPSFPMIFESATAGFGEWTPVCETLVIMSISGGGVLPLIMGKLTDLVGIAKAWWLVTACFGMVWTYPLATCVMPSYRKALNKVENGTKEDEDENEEDSRSEEYAATGRLESGTAYENIPL